jgi:hypothetical protein
MKKAVMAISAGLLLQGCGPRGAVATIREQPYDPKEGLPGATQVLFQLDPAAPGATFFDSPWPSELRQQGDGRPRLEGFPGEGTFFERYRALAEQTLQGASVSPTLYLRFSGPPPALTEGALRLLDIDPASPERGRSWPIVTRVSRDEGRRIPPFTLQVRVHPGFVLRPATRYALVLLRSGATPALGTPLAFEATKATVPRPDPREEGPRQALAPVYQELQGQGIPRGAIAALTSFRTHDPAAFTRRLLEHAASLQAPLAPRVLWAGWDAASSRPAGPAAYHTLRGVYCTPNYQQQTERAPYLSSGGSILSDPQGAPVLAPLGPGHPSFRPECGALLPARFVVTIPVTPPPPEGYPLVVTAHGTGGDALTFLGEEDFAGWASREGLAVVSTDQPLHGARGEAPRPGSNARDLKAPTLLGLSLPIELDPAMLFYNPLNPAASRGNLRQATVDAAMLLRLFAGLDLGSVAQLKGADGAPAAVRFRPDRILLAGHSQGSQSLAVLGALDPRVRGVLLSGCGGDTRYGVLSNKEFARFRPLAEALLGLAPGELDEFHPFLALVQALSDPIDPQSYAHLFHATTVAPRSVLHVEGIGDSYTPNVSAEALAAALRATPLAPVLRKAHSFELLGLRASPVVQGNARGGQATLALLQLAPTRGEDGHFVIYREPGAAALIRRFFSDVAAGQIPRLESQPGPTGSQELQKH